MIVGCMYKELNKQKTLNLLLLQIDIKNSTSKEMIFLHFHKELNI